MILSHFLSVIQLYSCYKNHILTLRSFSPTKCSTGLSGLLIYIIILITEGVQKDYYFTMPITFCYTLIGILGTYTTFVNLIYLYIGI